MFHKNTRLAQSATFCLLVFTQFLRLTHSPLVTDQTSYSRNKSVLNTHEKKQLLTGTTQP